MPAPRPVIYEIEDLKLDHRQPWSHEQLRDHRRRQRMEDSWFLVARGGEEVVDDVTVELAPTEVPTMLEVEHELSR
jgi:hypothetical protein